MDIFKLSVNIAESLQDPSVITGSLKTELAAQTVPCPTWLYSPVSQYIVVPKITISIPSPKKSLGFSTDYPEFFHCVDYGYKSIIKPTMKCKKFPK